MKIRTMVKTIVMPDLFSMLCKKRKVHIWFVRFVVCLFVGWVYIHGTELVKTAKTEHKFSLWPKMV